MTNTLMPMNPVALARAMEAVVGRQAAEVILGAYVVIEKALTDGFNAGYAKATDDHLNGIATVFNNGWVAGVVEGKAMASEEAYDDGYVDGVRDARARPDVADETVEDIMSDAAQRAADEVFNGPELSDIEEYFGLGEDAFDITLVRDSGDETARRQFEVIELAAARGPDFDHTVAQDDKDEIG